MHIMSCAFILCVAMSAQQSTNTRANGIKSRLTSTETDWYCATSCSGHPVELGCMPFHSETMCYITHFSTTCSDVYSYIAVFPQSLIILTLAICVLLSAFQNLTRQTTGKYICIKFNILLHSLMLKNWNVSGHQS